MSRHRGASAALGTASWHVKHAEGVDRPAWNAYVCGHANGTLYHLFGWADVVRAAYGHATHFLMLSEDDGRLANEGHSGRRILGVLPVVHMRHGILGNGLVSLPFLDGGGILADGTAAEERLLGEVVELGQRVGARYVELRQERALESGGRIGEGNVVTRSHKVRMLLRLPASPGLLLESFKSKLRSQVKKALKEGFTCRAGGAELVDDFYSVYLVNMRDLGSPVHSIKLILHSLMAFADKAKIIVVYRSAKPVAAGLVIGFGNVLHNPWASSLRKYASLGPNMLLYWRMLEYACDLGYDAFDFGRSTPGEGTYKFKEQWGAVPETLHWQYVSLDGRMPDVKAARNTRFGLAMRCWRKLPLIVTRIIGPGIRKHISL